MSTSFKRSDHHEGGTTSFQGSVESVTRDLIDWFGLTDTDGLTPFEIALRADEIAQACGMVITSMEATPVTQEQGTSAPAPSSRTDRVSGGEAAAGPPTDPWQAAEQSTEPSTPSMFATNPTASPEPADHAPSHAPSQARTGTSSLYAEIERATSVDKLHRLWAENQAAFADDELMDAWKAKGRALEQNAPAVVVGNASTNTGSTQGVAA